MPVWLEHGLLRVDVPDVATEACYVEGISPDDLVWNEVVKLLEHPELIEAEIERRLAAALETNPNKRREEALRRELTRTRKSMERLVTAYQETLPSLEEFACAITGVAPARASVAG